MRTLRPDRTLDIRPYERRDRTPARDLAFYNFYVHSHLDWQTVDDYLRQAPPLVWVAERGGRTVGVMGMSDVLTGTSWLRFAAISDKDYPREVMNEMWAYVTDELRALGVHTVAVLVLRNWLEDYLREWGFTYLEDIVTLRRYGRHLPQQHSPALDIRPVERADAETMLAIDHAAFEPLWQMSLSEVRHGIHVADSTTLAYLDGRPVGYQIATTHGMNGHLARLAVLPDTQGRGVGGALVRDMLAWFIRRGILTVTVNTQETNIRSQRLYEKYDFKRNGYDLPVWRVTL